MYQRYCEDKLVVALKDTPVVLMVGPRQCGKTTLARQMKGQDWTYITLDEVNQLEFAKQDPVGFIRNLTAPHVIIDEVQRVPELLLPIKQSIDENRSPGKFLLTGSAKAMLLPKIADSLAGRLEVVTLLPLSQCEIRGVQSTFLSKVFSGKAPSTQEVRIRKQLIHQVLSGGFPEPLTRKSEVRRMAWYGQYINSIIQKDLKDLGQLEHLEVMPKLVKILCNYAGQLINYSELAGRVGLSRQTVTRYLKLLEQLFIFQDLPAWHRNENKRFIKTPKAHIVDSGLLCALRRINTQRIEDDANLFGSLVENYVLCELRRLSSWHDEPINFYHYRDKDKVEVDIVIETISGAVIGIEVKTSATLKRNDFQGLERLKNVAGRDFLLGLLLYDGDHHNAYDENIFSVPFGVLWQ